MLFGKHSTVLEKVNMVLFHSPLTPLICLQVAPVTNVPKQAVTKPCARLFSFSSAAELKENFVAYKMFILNI